MGGQGELRGLRKVWSLHIVSEPGFGPHLVEPLKTVVWLGYLMGDPAVQMTNGGVVSVFAVQLSDHGV